MKSNQKQEFPIGINLGNTNSCVGVFFNGKIKIIPNDQGNRTTPSYVSFSDQEILVGDSSYCQIAKNPKNTVFNIIRFIGRNYKDPLIQNDMKLSPFQVEASPEDQPIIIVNYKGQEKKFRPEEISLMVLKKMKEIAENYLGRCVNSAVITVPAYFNDLQREILKDAGIISGVKVLQIIDQPIAASIAYGLDIKKKRNVLIFDLGGSTFEVSLVVLDQQKYNVKATSRDMCLGGVNFDNNITQYCGEEIFKQIGIDINTNFRAERRLRMQCERAKKTLSQSEQATIEIDNLIGNYDFSINITRFKFEQLCSDLFTRLIPPIEEVIKISQSSQDQIKQVLLVGGSSNIPKIQMIIKDLFHDIEIIKLGNPDETIAQGAAIMANGILMNNQIY